MVRQRKSRWAGDLVSGSETSGVVIEKTKRAGGRLPQRSDPRPMLMMMVTANIYSEPFSQILTQLDYMETPQSLCAGTKPQLTYK